ncbi:MAG: alkaline shock response membrane anchor protein AmaP [Haloechinothrix sp.]
MSGLNRPARLNRILLAVSGLLLVAVGALALAAYLGRIPVIDPASPLVPAARQPPVWVFAIVAVVAVIIGLLCLRWLVAQVLRRPRSQTWRVESDPQHGQTHLPASVAVAPLIADVAGYAGVRSARATLAGSQDNPILSLTITAEADADLNDVRGWLGSHAVPRLRQALDLDTLPTVVEFRFSSGSAARVA